MGPCSFAVSQLVASCCCLPLRMIHGDVRPDWSLASSLCPVPLSTTGSPAHTMHLVQFLSENYCIYTSCLWAAWLSISLLSALRLYGQLSVHARVADVPPETRLAHLNRSPGVNHWPVVSAEWLSWAMLGCLSPRSHKVSGQEMLSGKFGSIDG